MHKCDLRETLRNSEMDYSFKITKCTLGIYVTPCPPGKSLDGKYLDGCKTPRRNSMEHPEDWKCSSIEWCLEKCMHPIDKSLLSKKQIKLYEKIRPEWKKLTDISQHPENNEVELEMIQEVRIYA